MLLGSSIFPGIFFVEGAVVVTVVAVDVGGRVVVVVVVVVVVLVVGILVVGILVVVVVVVVVGRVVVDVVVVVVDEMNGPGVDAFVVAGKGLEQFFRKKVMFGWFPVTTGELELTQQAESC
jgi:hypothetical protein